MFIDLNEVNSGSLLKDLTPSIVPAKEIVDPNDHKPESWDEREKIPDPNAVKPEDWDENEPKQIADSSAVKPEGWLDDELEMMPDLEAVKPEDWDTETDGEWEAPKVENSKCKEAPGCGVWNPPMIDNPKYKGNIFKINIL
jgi:calnexin